MTPLLPSQASRDAPTMPMGCVLSRHSLLRRKRLSPIRTGTGFAMETGKYLQVAIGTQSLGTLLAGCHNRVFHHLGYWLNYKVTRTIEIALRECCLRRRSWETKSVKYTVHNIRVTRHSAVHFESCQCTWRAENACPSGRPPRLGCPNVVWPCTHAHIVIACTAAVCVLYTHRQPWVVGIHNHHVTF